MRISAWLTASALAALAFHVASPATAGTPDPDARPRIGYLEIAGEAPTAAEARMGELARERYRLNEVVNVPANGLAKLIFRDLRLRRGDPIPFVILTQKQYEALPGMRGVLSLSGFNWIVFPSPGYPPSIPRHWGITSSYERVNDRLLRGPEGELVELLEQSAECFAALAGKPEAE